MRNIVLIVAMIGCYSCLSCHRCDNTDRRDSISVDTTLSYLRSIDPEYTTPLCSDPPAVIIMDIVPYDNITQDYLKDIKDSILHFVAARKLGILIERLPNENYHLSEKYYYKPRKRYLAVKILEDMGKEYKNRDFQFSTIHLTDKDISMPLHGSSNYGIIGLASIKHRVAIVSTHRVPKANVWKAILHEFCHTRGMVHCNDDKCIMASGKGRGDFSN